MVCSLNGTRRAPTRGHSPAHSRQDFREERTGYNSKRSALNQYRKEDTPVVHSMDRLARNVEDMLTLVRGMNDRAYGLNSLKRDMTRAMLMFTMLSAFAQFERSLAG